MKPGYCIQRRVLANGWTIWGFKSQQGEDFPSPKPLDWLCGPPSLLFSAGKLAGT